MLERRPKLAHRHRLRLGRCGRRGGLRRKNGRISRMLGRRKRRPNPSTALAYALNRDPGRAFAPRVRNQSRDGAYIPRIENTKLASMSMLRTSYMAKVGECDKLTGLLNFAARKFQHIHLLDAEPMSVTVSAGVSIVDPKEQKRIPAAVSRAENALSEAKEAGRNCCILR